MPWFFMDSLQHYTTRAQRETKQTTGNTPTAGAGAFGQPGSRPFSTGGGGDEYNFAAKNELVVSVHWKPIATAGAMIYFYTTTGLQFRLWVYSDGSIEVRRGDNDANLGRSAAGVVTFNVQHHLRVAVVCHPTLGKVQIDIDGSASVPASRVLNLTNINTDCKGTATITQMQFSGDGESNQGDCYWSHHLFGDTFADGDGLQPRVSAVFISANAADNSMTQVGGTPADPKTVVNETSPDDTNYLEGDTAGQRNSFEFANSIPALGRVLAIQSVARVSKTDSATRAGRTYFTIGGVRYFGTNKAIPASPAYNLEVFNVNPATGLEFTPAQVNAPLIAGYDVVL